MEISREKITRILLGFKPPLSHENVREMTDKLLEAEKAAIAEAKRRAKAAKRKLAKERTLAKPPMPKVAEVGERVEEAALR